MSPSGSRSASPGGNNAAGAGGGPPAAGLFANGGSSTTAGSPQFNLHLLPRVPEDEDEISPPLRSPSMLKPFRPNPQLVRRRGGTVYVFAIIGGAFTLFILFIVLLSSGGSSTSLGSTNSHSRANNLKRYGYAATASSSASLSRLSSYLGTYLPFLDQYYNSAAMISLTSSAYLFGHTAEGVPTLHPILPLLQNAKTRAESLFSRQSTTLSQAVSQYRKRYKQDPPKGFDKWWSFAKARNHSLVDEYDSLMRDINTFSSLQPHILKQRTRTLAQLPGISLITIKDGKAQIHSKSGKWAPALALQEMMNAFVSTLPDMEIAINEKPEGRVLPGKWKEVKLDEWADDDIPLDLQREQSESRGKKETFSCLISSARGVSLWLDVNESLTIARCSSRRVSVTDQTDPLADQLASRGFKSEWRRDGSVWEAFRRACPPESAARRLVESLRSAESSTNSRQMRLQHPTAAQQQQSDVYYASALSRRRAESSGGLPRTRELTFSSDVDATLDLCSMPSLHTLHSAYYSDTRSIQYLYPLFSPSKPSGFADLLIPFHQYWAPPSEVTYENEFRKGRSKTPMDVDWDKKDSKVYWRGKVLRGAETPAGHFSSFQKPRLVKLANDDGSYFTGKEDTPSWKKITPTVPPHRVLVTINATSSSLVSMSAPGPRINEYVMDVALSCDPQLGECAEQERLGYKVLPPSPLSDAWKHKFVVDLDEIGLSPKFPAVIESKSAVVKSSMQREFWQDWIVPWYHYIPLSSSYAELYNIQAFFAGFPEQFKNRRSMSASSPKQKDVANMDKDEKVATNTEDAEMTSVIVDGAAEDDANSYTLLQEMESLKPINPAHGPIFDGDLALKDIADQGAQWRREHMRREDMEVC